MVLTVIGIIVILWGLATLFVGLARPKGIWSNAKIQGFVSLMSETGTTIILSVVGLAAVALGLWLVL